MPVLTGSGLLSGSSPTGLVTVGGTTPVAATIRVQLRFPGDPDDGVHVAETTSAADGTWVISGINESLRYDVIGRYAGYNDVIMSDVAPWGSFTFTRVTETGDTRVTETGLVRITE